MTLVLSGFEEGLNCTISVVKYSGWQPVRRVALLLPVSLNEAPFSRERECSVLPQFRSPTCCIARTVPLCISCAVDGRSGPVAGNFKKRENLRYGDAASSQPYHRIYSC